MKKAWKWIIVIVVVLLLLRACGKKLIDRVRPEAPQEETVETTAPVAEAPAPANTQPAKPPVQAKPAPTPQPEPEEEPEAPEEEPEEEPAPEPSGIRPEFKEAMDSYEAFYKEYCDFMKQYQENPTDLALLGKYAELLARTEEMDRKFEQWDEDELSDEELKYYIDVNARVQKMLADLI